MIKKRNRFGHTGRNIEKNIRGSGLTNSLGKFLLLAKTHKKVSEWNGQKLALSKNMNKP